MFTSKFTYYSRYLHLSVSLTLSLSFKNKLVPISLSPHKHNHLVMTAAYTKYFSCKLCKCGIFMLFMKRLRLSINNILSHKLCKMHLYNLCMKMLFLCLVITLSDVFQTYCMHLYIYSYISTTSALNMGMYVIRYI